MNQLINGSTIKAVILSRYDLSHSHWCFDICIHQVVLLKLCVMWILLNRVIFCVMSWFLLTVLFNSHLTKCWLMCHHAGMSSIYLLVIHSLILCTAIYYNILVSLCL
jgi:hypothetical protein